VTDDPNSGPEDHLAPTVRESEALETSRQIGPYRLEQVIGQGGMGEVWLAEQTEPIRRRVALKIIKPGMDSRQVVARFEAERQALALMSHPYVAKVYDAGTTPGGRPFFAMEYVPGVPITEYCERHKLTLRQRLELFQKVCEGVQHAHHKAIIHRDLKPGNVLVMQQDGVAQPKIIDFGVAKATSQKLTEQTMFTQIGVLIGTPEYMSPEQADLTGEDVDTRTDVYSLGVILYELLAGALPFEPTELRKAGFDGIRRMIREDTPARPSVRASVITRNSPEGTQGGLPRNLSRALSGDLDWIALKALEKDRGRRYESPADFARDIGRHLMDEPVVARPPTLSYRAGRFVRRNRLGVTFAVALALVLIGSGVGLALLYARSLDAERIASSEAATAEEALAFMTGLFEAANPLHGGGGPPTVLEVLDIGAARLAELDGQPVVQVKLMGTMAMAYNQLGDWNRGRVMFEQAIETQVGLTGRLDLTVADLNYRLAHNRILAEDYATAMRYSQESMKIWRQLLGEVSRPHADVLGQLGFAAVKAGHYADAETHARAAIEVLDRLEEDVESMQARADALHVLGWALAGQKKAEASAEAFEECLILKRQYWGEQSPSVGWSLNMYGWMLVNQEEDPEQIHRGIALLEECYAISDRAFGGHHIELAYARINAAMGYYNLGDFATAEAYAREAVAMASNFLDDRGHLGGMKLRWARYLVALGREEEAREILAPLARSLERYPEAAERLRTARQLLAELDSTGTAGE
jgi:non-specific serine/threonine protein kinase/serine/threonine-protein kinase